MAQDSKWLQIKRDFVYVFWTSLNRGKEELIFKVGLERPALTFTFQASVRHLGSGMLLFFFHHMTFEQRIFYCSHLAPCLEVCDNPQKL